MGTITSCLDGADSEGGSRVIVLSIIETLASWQIPTAQNWPVLNRLLIGPARRVIALESPGKSFFAALAHLAPTIMERFLHTAQNMISMGLNSHMAHFTLDPSDIYLLPEVKPNGRGFSPPLRHTQPSSWMDTTPLSPLFWLHPLNAMELRSRT